MALNITHKMTNAEIEHAARILNVSPGALGRMSFAEVRAMIDIARGMAAGSGGPTPGALETPPRDFGIAHRNSWGGLSPAPVPLVDLQAAQRQSLEFSQELQNIPPLIPREEWLTRVREQAEETIRRSQEDMDRANLEAFTASDGLMPFDAPVAGPIPPGAYGEYIEFPTGPPQVSRQPDLPPVRRPPVIIPADGNADYDQAAAQVSLEWDDEFRGHWIGLVMAGWDASSLSSLADHCEETGRVEHQIGLRYVLKHKAWPATFDGLWLWETVPSPLWSRHVRPTLPDRGPPTPHAIMNHTQPAPWYVPDWLAAALPYTYDVMRHELRGGDFRWVINYRHFDEAVRHLGAALLYVNAQSGGTS